MLRKNVKKDVLNGTYTQVASVSSGITTFVDTVPVAGTYWYKVKLHNMLLDHPNIFLQTTD